MARLLATDKKSIIRKFIIDVMKDRVQKYAEDLSKAVTDYVQNLFSTKEVQDLMQILTTNKDILDRIGIENWEIDDFTNTTTELPYEMDLNIFPWRHVDTAYSIKDREFGVSAEIMIPLPIAVPAKLNLDNIIDMEAEKFSKFNDRLNKMEQDVQRLIEAAEDTLHPLRTDTALEKEAPELFVYYHHVPEESGALAQMADCMRVNDDC